MPEKMLSSVSNRLACHLLFAVTYVLNERLQVDLGNPQMPLALLYSSHRPRLPMLLVVIFPSMEALATRHLPYRHRRKCNLLFCKENIMPFTTWGWYR